MSTREEFWREALSELSASGLSMRQFCRERNLKYHCALYWRRRLGEREQADTSLSFATLQLPVQALPPNPALSDDSGVVVECEGGAGAPLSRHFDESVLLRVIGAFPDGYSALMLAGVSGIIHRRKGNTVVLEHWKTLQGRCIVLTGTPTQRLNP